MCKHFHGAVSQTNQTSEWYNSRFKIFLRKPNPSLMTRGTIVQTRATNSLTLHSFQVILRIHFVVRTIRRRVILTTRQCSVTRCQGHRPLIGLRSSPWSSSRRSFQSPAYDFSRVIIATPSLGKNKTAAILSKLLKKLWNQRLILGLMPSRRVISARCYMFHLRVLLKYIRGKCLEHKYL